MITTVTYKKGYTLGKDYCSVRGDIEATATVDEGETSDQAYKAIQKQVQARLKIDFAESESILQEMLDRQK